SPLVS
ncbi:cytochrome C and Quinol oxidase polypeptide I family protein, partial [Vibrio parahaemolyticus EKP-008]